MFKHEDAKPVHSGLLEVPAGATSVALPDLSAHNPAFIDLVPVVPAANPDAATEVTYSRRGVAVTNGFPLTVNSAPLQLNAATYPLVRFKNAGTTSAWLYYEICAFKY